MSLIHRYQNNGYNIVLDINSGCIHVVDEVTYEVLPYMEEGLDTAAIVGKLGDQFSEEDIKTSVAECEKLKADGMLSPEMYMRMLLIHLPRTVRQW